MASALTYFIVLVLFLVLRGPGLLNNFLSQEYKVHNTGIVVISGASSGIGKHAALELANSGYTVYAGVRSQKDVQNIREEGQSLKAEGKMKGDIEAVILDVTKEDTIEAVRAKVENSGLPLVAVVNNAGASVRFPAEQTDITLSQRVFDINYWGSIRLTNALLPLLRKYEGRVIFVSSVAAIGWHYGSAIYSGTKRAIEAFADSLRIEMMEFGVSVSIVEPGYIKTNIENAGKTTPEDIGLTQDTISPYEYFWGVAHKNRENSFSRAPGPEVTSEVIKDSIVNPHPMSRYVVGPATSLLSGYQVSILVPLLPNRLVDFIANKEYRKLEKK